MDTVLYLSIARCTLRCDKTMHFLDKTLPTIRSSSIYKSETSITMTLNSIAFMFYSFKVFNLQHICANNLHSMEDTRMQISRFDGLMMVNAHIENETNQLNNLQVISKSFSHSVTREARP